MVTIVILARATIVSLKYRFFNSDWYNCGNYLVIGLNSDRENLTNL